MFEYEQGLAKDELKSLGARIIRSTATGVVFDHEAPASLTSRLTYLSGLDIGGALFPCEQRATELIHLATRPRTSRQATRFGVHGFHEYKGKFNPQLARALINIADPEARVVVDPFAGSGTALIEALRLGLAAHGRDRSPIAVFIASAKLGALTSPTPRKLASELLRLADVVGVALKRGQDSASATKVPSWCSDTARYLRDWFTSPAFGALTHGLNAHEGYAQSLAGQLSLLCLSAILRSVSLQEPQDLRVRRRPAGFLAPSLRDAYTDQVDRVASSLGELEPWVRKWSATALRGNADDSDLFRGCRGRRLIVTSPPYATALPYIDTDRLSILALGLATPPQVHVLEAGLTGSREWNTGARDSWWNAFRENRNDLPSSVVGLLSEIATVNEANGAGFRRAAVPPLLYRYFSEMTAALTSWSRQLRVGERAVIVVGRNRTGERGSEITIDTPILLADCGGIAGFELVEQIHLETWPRYGLHAANGVGAEDAIVLQRV
jgi:hypothetical protein